MKAGANTVSIWALPLVVLTLACIVIATDPGGIAAFIRGGEFDAYQHIRPRPYQDTAAETAHPVKILEVDSAGTARFGRWPWPRAVLAKLTGELKSAGAAVIVFDMPLDTPAPEVRFLQSLPDTSQTAALRLQLARFPSPDERLASAISAVPSVTGFELGENGRMPAMKSSLDFTGAGRASTITPNYTTASGSLSEIEAASAGIGAENLPAGSDGEVRSVPLMFQLNGNFVPSLDAEALRLVSGAGNVEITDAETGLPGLDAKTIVANARAGDYDVRLKPDGALEIYFAGHRDERYVSAAALDEGQVTPGALKGAIIYISSPDATVPTPDGLVTRAELRAEALENMLLGSGLKPATSPDAEIAFVVIVGAGLLFLFARGQILWAALTTAGAITAAQGLAWFLFANDRTLLDAANPSVALAAAFVAGFGARHIEVEKARTRLRSSFADSLPPKAILAIAKKPSLLNLDGETRVVTCLSCGIRGFARIAETFADDPSGFTRLINAIMAPLIEDAIRYGGMIARFDSENFTACWNAPLDDAEHAIHACEAANRMTVTLAEMNEQLGRERRLDGTAYDPVEIGIGISTGRVIAGGFTARGRPLYSVTGDATVMAERIRAISSQYGPAIIATEDARKAAQRGFAFLEVDFIAAGPREEPVKLYAMLGNPLVRASPKFRALETFHEHIFQSLRLQQWHKARELIAQCRKLSGASQKIYDLHLARIAYFETHPPGADWDGAFRPILK